MGILKFTKSLAVLAMVTILNDHLVAQDNFPTPAGKSYTVGQTYVQPNPTINLAAGYLSASRPATHANHRLQSQPAATLKRGDSQPRFVRPARELNRRPGVGSSRTPQQQKFARPAVQMKSLPSVSLIQDYSQQKFAKPAFHVASQPHTSPGRDATQQRFARPAAHSEIPPGMPLAPKKSQQKFARPDVQSLIQPADKPPTSNRFLRHQAQTTKPVPSASPSTSRFARPTLFDAEPLEIQKLSGGDLPVAQNATTRSIGDLSDIKFAKPDSFLKSNDFNFADPNKFLKDSPDDRRADSSKSQTPPSKLASAPTPLVPLQDQDQNVPDSFQSQPIVNSSTSNPSQDSERYLTVSDVNAPISLNPFAEIDQSLATDSGAKSFLKPYIEANTYSDLTGQYFQHHIASWNAHNFQHKPLFFEEVNLERYGNELKYQRVMSAAHFFTSAALMPYKWGANPCNCCLTTLGHRRPGECVPYLHHKTPVTARGLLFQGLIISALSL